MSSASMPYFQEVTTKTPALFKPLRQNKSYVVVYIWNPLSDEDFGHAAIKVVDKGEEFYFSWFPSGDHYGNAPGLFRSTPQFYGRKSYVNYACKENAEKRVRLLYGAEEPDNFEQQVNDLLRRQSDKLELHKSATFKVFFDEGIDIHKLLEWWRTLLASNHRYNVNSNNCCDVVLRSLQYALDTDKYDLLNVKTNRMKENHQRNPDNILNSHRYDVSPNTGTKAATVYKYCYLLGVAINSQENSDENGGPVVVRFNRWNKKERCIVAFDFDPKKFDPNWMTVTQERDPVSLYTSIINSSFSDVMFSQRDKSVELRNSDLMTYS